MSDATFRCEVLSVIGSFGVPGSQFPNEPNPSETEYEAPAIFQNRTFSITLNFQVNTASEGSTAEQWQNVTGPIIVGEVPTGIRVEFPTPSSIRIVGPHENAFPDESFVFAMFPDYSLKTLPLNNQEDYLALCRWNIPSQMIITRSVALTVKNGVGVFSQDYPFEYIQQVGWNFDDTAPRFREVLAGR